MSTNFKTEGTEMKKKFPIWLIVIIAAVIIAVAAFAVVHIMNENTAKRLQSCLDSGNKYLDEMEYELAIASFEEAISIDPQNVDGYIGIVEAYIRMNDMDNAYKWAKQGYEATGDDRLKEYMDMIESGNIYDALGYLHRESFFENNELLTYVQYTYDKNGRRDEVSRYNPDGSLAFSDHNIYDEDGNCTHGAGWLMTRNAEGTTVVIRVSDNQTEGNVHTHVEYDESGAVVESGVTTYAENGMDYEYFGYDADGVQNSHCVKTYTEDKQEKKIINYDRDGNLMQILTNEYDDHGNRILTTYEHEEGVIFSQTAYTYDDKDRPISSVTHNGEGEVTGREEWEYDEVNHTETRIAYRKDGSMSEQETTYFDEEGNEISRDRKTYDN